LKELGLNPIPNIHAKPVDETNDLYTWEATIMGPVNIQIIYINI
jgi:ubiquitin-protein ligase